MMGDSIDDIDLLINLLNADSDKDVPTNVQVGTLSKENFKRVTGNTESIDPLELELRIMEEKMNKLKAELCKKKNISKIAEPMFTKFTSIVEKPSENVRELSAAEAKSLINKLQNRKSALHEGETDSEDEEDNRNPMEPQFSISGRDIRKRLAHADDKSILSKRTFVNPLTNNNKNRPSGWKKLEGGSLLPIGSRISTQSEDKNPGVADPFSGIKIVNPLVSASSMSELMSGRRMVQISTVKSHLRGGDIEGDWVTIAVVAAKSDPKTSQKGSQYSIWTLTDLKDCTVVISLFLFAEAYKQLWKTAIGSVIGVLNPQIMKDREDDKRNALTVSVNTHQKILAMGSSKDLGWCKGRTQAKDHCRNFVNKSICEFCIFHIEREYKKSCSRRSEIQSSFTQSNPRKRLQDKVLGKNQVFYGGQMYGSNSAVKSEGPLVKSKAIPANRSKDLSTLSSLTVKLKAQDLREQDRKASFVLKNLSDAEVSTIQQVTKDNEYLYV